MKNTLLAVAFAIFLIVGILADGLMDSYGEMRFICIAGATLVLSAGLLLIPNIIKRIYQKRKSRPQSYIL